MSQTETPQRMPAEDEKESGLEFPPYLTGVVVAILVGLGDNGRTPLVAFPGGSAEALQARTTVALTVEDVGRQVVLVFEQNESLAPIILGCLRSPTTPGSPSYDIELDADGKKLIVSAKEQIVLRCGEASITLTKAGKVLISGAYVSTRSSGVNRVQGGSVQLN